MDAPVRARMRALSAQYPRYGYRRVRIFLEREGYRMSVERAHRLWRAEGLQVPRKRPRRRVAASRPRPLPPTGPRQVWAYEFVFDACANGQKLKCLTVVDEWTRESLAIDVAGSIRSGRVIEVLARLVSVHGAPRYLRSDNGPEFVSADVGAERRRGESGLDTPGPRYPRAAAGLGSATKACVRTAGNEEDRAGSPCIGPLYGSAGRPDRVTFEDQHRPTPPQPQAEPIVAGSAPVASPPHCVSHGGVCGAFPVCTRPPSSWLREHGM